MGERTRRTSATRSVTRAIPIAGACVILFVLAGLVFHLVDDRSHELARAERNNANLVHLLAEQTARTVQAIDLTLVTAAHVLEHDRSRGADSSREIHEFLRESSAAIPFIWGLLVTDAHGIVRYSSESFPVAALDFSDHTYFVRQRDGPALGLHIGAPTMSRPVSTGTVSRRLISMSRRLTTPDGRFAGVVVAAVEPAYIRSLYDGLDVGREGSVAMFLRDGTMMVRSPHVESFVGKSFAGWPLFRQHLATAAAGNVRTAAGIDGVARLLSYRAVPVLPLVVVVTRSEAEVLAAWWRSVVIETAAALVLVGMIAGLTAMLSRHVRKLSASEDRFRSLFERSPEALLLIDPDGPILDANPAAERLFGRTATEIRGRQWTAHIDGTDGRFAAALEEHRQTGRFRGELRLRRTNGTTVPVDVTTHGFVDGQGMKRIAVNIRDVRAQRRLETQARLQATALAAAANAIVITDRDGTIVWTNPATTAMTGYTAAELRGQNPRILKSGRQPGEVYESLWRTITVGRAWQGRLINRRKDGTLYHEEQTVTPVLDERGDITHFVAIKQDISARLEAEEELGRQRELARRQERLAEMGRLLAGVAHELNNPLAVVLAHANLLGRKTRDAAVAARAGKIRESADRCARIVKNFLALARQHPAETRTVALNTIVRETLELLAYQLRIESIAVALDLDDDLPDLAGDPHQLQQVLMNLVLNAADALRSTATGRELRIRTRHDAASVRAVLEVRDSGPGLAESVRARLFEPFVTTKPVGEGTGLGLSICKGIVESHGGTISAESVEGHGAAFRVELPIRAVTTVEPGPAGPAPADPELSVLVVDDEQDVASVLAEIVGGRVARVDVAGNGAVAMAQLRARDYDVVFCDLKMPVMDGAALYGALLRERPDLATRVVFVTGDTFRSTTPEFLAETGRPFIAKPFSESDVWRAVATVTGRVIPGTRRASS